MPGRLAKCKQSQRIQDSPVAELEANDELVGELSDDNDSSAIIEATVRRIPLRTGALVDDPDDRPVTLRGPEPGLRSPIPD